MPSSPDVPLYIVSKGRFDSRLTSKALERMRVPYHIVVEEQEYVDYCAVIDKVKVLVLDKSYQRAYDTFDDLGESKSKGPGPARNFAWDHAIASGASWHWVMDDNIRHFLRLHNNLKVEVLDGVFFKIMEDFVMRYTNIGMAGPNYAMFCPRKRKKLVLTLNTRVYSCNLIRNDLPYRWRGRYNEDTDLSLRMLKDGLCTVLFNALLQQKIMTQIVKGGCTAEFYAKEGTLPKSKMQVRMHPDVSELVFKFNRWHHRVDYSRFTQVPKLKEHIIITDAPNEYGMALVTRSAAAK